MNKSEEIVKVIKEALDKHPELGETTPTMLDPFNYQPTIGLMVNTDEGARLAYTINILDLSKQPTKN